MLCTREKEPGKEVKVGCLFKGSDCLNPNSNASYLSAAQYVVHLGTSRDFYHAPEYLYQFADKAFPRDAGEKKQWCERYNQYRNMGCGITGSGTIESAHRTVVQKG
ncbi:MAG: hypothetical protein LBP72_02855 [Dysgonamonadaceae bacterium]|jgi:hypothetical protein|nr:hypothetical protein [Dysgonamonadaceae bacterium]